MFNALGDEELLRGLGRVMRHAADADGPLTDYRRSQLLSGLSVTRLLAAERRAQTELLEATRTALLAALPDDSAGEVARVALMAAGDGPAIGAAITDLLSTLGADDPARAAIHAALRTMVEAEVTALGA